ncbi:PTS system oligo-beta-mannoside-specific EIIC component [uncultured Clostridium sp.]|uniref:PTS sugar transporter subunit IIC n=1 Tax=uncultured Clostridium sp. TaxID=59620 RepID=UPI0008213FE7|nr:PTS sugar transporter subunit IIC [uncultured Clostridium sp.]SCJ89710.1 PTS system oligo-beta-mannoside-specific EIIC component [uncultured Clostridium sp.]
MRKFSEKIAMWLAPVATKFSNQRHLVAIRDGFIAVMPLVIVGSLFVLINNVILDSGNGLLKDLGNFDRYKEIGLSVYYGTLGFLSIFLAFGVAYKLAKAYDLDGLATGFIAVAAVLALMPTTVTSGDVSIGGVFSETYTSAIGLFVALIGSILSTELLKILSKKDKLKIKMPDSVPPAVSKSFNILVPACIVLIVFALISFLCIEFLGMNVYEIINKIIQTPLQAIFQGLPGIVMILFFQNLLWSFGLHGAFILSPITEPTLMAAIQENINALQAGEFIPNIVTKPFLDAFCFSGGGGFTIGLIIAIFIASKRADHRSIAKLGAVPGCFNINEPLVFGLPIVLNPLFMLPLMLIPAINLIIAYLATAAGLIEKTVVAVPWTTPPIVSAYLATGGDWKAAALSAGLIVLSVILYMPFVIAANRELNMEDMNKETSNI